jgi:hypothetical protein
MHTLWPTSHSNEQRASSARATCTRADSCACRNGITARDMRHLGDRATDEHKMGRGRIHPTDYEDERAFTLRNLKPLLNCLISPGSSRRDVGQRRSCRARRAQLVPRILRPLIRWCIQRSMRIAPIRTCVLARVSRTCLAQIEVITGLIQRAAPHIQRTRRANISKRRPSTTMGAISLVASA